MFVVCACLRNRSIISFVTFTNLCVWVPSTAWDKPGPMGRMVRAKTMFSGEPNKMSSDVLLLAPGPHFYHTTRPSMIWSQADAMGLVMHGAP